MAAQEKATAIEAMVKVTKEEVAQVVTRYKASEEFEDGVNKVIYDAFYKGFDEYKRKVALAFHLLDLKEIITDKLEVVEGDVDTLVRDVPTEIIEVIESEADLDPPQESQATKAIEKSDQLSSVWETIT